METSCGPVTQAEANNIETATFSLLAPPAKIAHEYFSFLKEKGFLSPYHGCGPDRYMQLSFPIAVPIEILQTLKQGHELNQLFIREEYPSLEALHAHLEKTAPLIDGKPLVHKEISRQIFEHYTKLGIGLPGALDVMCTDKGIRVVENQSAFGYLGELDAELAAVHHAGYQLSTMERHMGDRAPEVAMRDFKKLLVGDSGIMHVVDIDSLTDGSVGDRIYLAKILGNNETLPLNLKNIERDPTTGKVGFREEIVVNGSVQESGRIVVPNAIFNRATPSELRTAEQYLRECGAPEKVALIHELYTDPQITWGLHPGVYSIIDKGNLAKLAQFAIERNHPFAACFAPMYSEGEAVPPGSYALKVRDGMSGEGLKLIRIEELGGFQPIPGMRLEAENGGVSDVPTTPGTYKVKYSAECKESPDRRVDIMEVLAPGSVYQVPAGRMAQEQFHFVKIQVEVPKAVRPEGYMDATLEIRSFRYPNSSEHESYMFAYRAAPRECDGKAVLTNLGPSMRAYDTLLTQAGLVEGTVEISQARERSLFGMGAVRVVGGRNYNSY